MKRQKQRELLDSVLCGVDIEGFRRDCLELGLGAVRRRRQRRRWARTGMFCLLTCVLAVAACLLANPSALQRLRHPHAMALAAKPASSVRIISDKELFALFPGRSLALVGPPGRQQLLFLDQRTRPN